MKPSPLTLLTLDFLRVHIHANHEAKQTVEEFDFEGATLSWSIKHGQHDDGSWWVAVGFATDDDAEAEQRCPYDLDMRALGSFTIAESVAADRREEIVYENGAALVYGAIREMTASVTARSIAGKLMLPTPTFVGAFIARMT
jgi:hypothetical protein